MEIKVLLEKLITICFKQYFLGNSLQYCVFPENTADFIHTLYIFL